ncbi:MAG: HEAT repeat domain-containing protein [Acidobacteriota bacterium]
MAKRPGLEERLADLNTLRQEGDTALVVRELGKALGQRTAPVVARAAEIAGALGLSELAPIMASAFDRCLIDPVKSDKGCLAKTAVARSLHALEEPAGELFRKGIRHVQMEPSWGPPIDTAAELRGVCAHGLIDAGEPRAVLEVVRLLADAQWKVRAEAARALGGASPLEAEPVLRLKALLGDEEPEVTSECLGSLLALAPETSLELAVDCLDSSSLEVAQVAALALGESRLEGAVAPLSSAHRHAVDEELRKALAMAMALTRRPEALDYLVEVVAEGGARRAEEAMRALALQRHEQAFRERLRGVLEDAGSPALWAIWDEEIEG